MLSAGSDVEGVKVVGEDPPGSPDPHPCLPLSPVRRTPQPTFQVDEAAALVRAEPVVAALAAIRAAAPGYE
jgi:hypothetical protein